MSAILSHLCISKGGMPKLDVAQAFVTLDGVGDDWQLNRKYHGGRDRAVCIYSEELYDWLRCDFQIDLKPGSVGENFTTKNLDLETIGPGDRLKVRQCIIEITKVREPCRQLNQWDPRLLKIITGNSGWMARVLEPGIVYQGDAIEVMAREVVP